jgi:hypothetical protein
LSALLAGAASAACCADGGQARAGCLQGSFIQLVDANKSWSQAQWQQLFAEMRKLGLRHIVLQWSVIDDQAFYRSRSFRSTPEPVLEWIMELAEKSGMQVMLGLSHQSKHWQMVDDKDARQGYLAQQIERVARTAGELVAGAAKSRAFAGWYLSEEVDDINWVDDAANEWLRSYLFQATSLLKTITPGAPIGISTFANEKTPPKNLERFWKRLLERVPALDVVYFQDGIGVHKLGLDKLPEYYEAMARATASQKKELRPVIELFEQTSGAPINQEPFAARPAPLERIFRQLEVADGAARASQHVSFSVPEYLSTLGGDAAAAAFEAYIEAMRERGLRGAE